MPTNTHQTSLNRQLGLLGLAATGICSMLGASIYVVPFMIQRHVPGIGPYVLPAFVFAALPAVMAAFAYAALGSVMPKAGGSYIYVSRGLHPYWGFVASFSQWFGLSIAIGVIAYIIVPFLRDIAGAAGWTHIQDTLDTGWVRLFLALAILWLFIWVNLRGLRSYERVLIPLMVLMFLLGAIMIVAGFYFNHQDFAMALQNKEGREIPIGVPIFKWQSFFAASALLFSSFIGFDSIAQAGGEAVRPEKNLPRAILIAVSAVGGFYFLFTLAVYHAVPWYFVAAEAQIKDITAPGLMAYLMPQGWSALVLAGAAIALINDLPAMILSVSRLMFAWAEDGIFPQKIASIHPRWQTPHHAILVSGGMSTIGILGSHFAGDFFLGIDIMVTAMLVNFLLMCITLLALHRRNPVIYGQMKVLKNKKWQLVIGWTGCILLAFFLGVHTIRDLQAEVTAWYFRATLVWAVVMGLGSGVYFGMLRGKNLTI